MLARVLEFAGLTGFGAAFIMSSTGPDLAQAEVIKWGGLFALVTFMVTQNYRQGLRMAKAIESKDRQIAKANAASARLSVDFTEAINRNSKALEDLTAVIGKSVPLVQT